MAVRHRFPQDTVILRCDNAITIRPQNSTSRATGNGFSCASVVLNNTGFGLTPGTPVDLAATSGLPLQTISQALIPRLGLLYRQLMIRSHPE